MLPHHASAQTPGHSPADLAATARSLDELRQDFPAFRIWREVTRDRIVYVVRRRQPETRLHTLVTRDPSELRAILLGHIGAPGEKP